MAYNSDGYIMLDFIDVDFKKTNQIIDGMYERCQKIIGTNKFCIVINANKKTPLPSVVSFINSQYVIESCIYTFAITANDNIFIKRNDVPASDIIDDSDITVNKTWSSDKINTELDGKQDTLIAGDNITIENNVISADGGGGAIIDDTVIVNNKVWSSLHTVEQLAPVEKLSGDEVTFNTSLALPLKSAKFSLVAQQSGSGTPSPSNPMPIIGADEMNISANSITHLVDLNGTCYGAVYDAVSGLLKVTHAYYKTTGLETIQQYNYQNRAGVYIANCLPVSATRPRYISNMGSGETYGNNSIWAGVNSTAIYWIGILDILEITTIEAFRAWLVDNPLEIAYVMPEPIEIQLPPLLLEAVEGQNTFSCDTGDTEIIYNYLPIDKLNDNT